MCREHAVGFLFLIGVFVTGCNWITDHPICAAEVRPAVEVEGHHAETNTLLADSARGVLRDGLYVDTMRAGSSASGGRVLTLAGRWGHAGTYDVRMTTNGFEPGTRSGIEVTKTGDECRTVNTRDLTARLSPTTSGP